MIKPILSIIIPSYNTETLTLNCLKSIAADKGLDIQLKDRHLSPTIPTEIIVVDNNSSDNTLALIRALPFPVEVISSPQNLGFGKANNLGLQHSQGNYILFLNSDTLILHSAISQSLNWLSSHPESYGCTAQLLNQDLSIQASGGYFPNLLNIATWCLGIDDLPFINSLIKPLHPHTPSFYTRDKYYLRDHPQDWVTGAFFLLRQDILNKVGGFDPDYFMYSEELELSYRIHQHFPNYKLWYLVGPQIIHLGGASTTDKQKIYDREYQGILNFFQKHQPHLEYNLVKQLLAINRLLRQKIYPLFKNA